MKVSDPDKTFPDSFAAIARTEISELREALGRPSEVFSMRLAVCDDPGKSEALVRELAAACHASVISVPVSANDPILECVRQLSGSKPKILFITGLHARDDFAPLFQSLEKSDFERWHSHFPASLVVFWLTPSLLREIHAHAPTFRTWCVREHVICDEKFAERHAEIALTPLGRLESSRLDSWERMRRLSQVEQKLRECTQDEPAHDSFVKEQLMILLQMCRFEAVLDRIPALLASGISRAFLRSIQDIAGLAHIGLHNATAAIECFSSARSIADELNDIHAIAVAKGHLGLAHFTLGNFKRAKACYVGALKSWRDCHDKKMEQIDRANLGSIYHSEGTLNNLPAWYEEGLLAAEIFGDPVAQAHMLNLLGIYFLDKKQNKKSMELHSRSLKICHAISDRRGECRSLKSIGNTYVGYGNFREAEKHYLQSAEVAGDCHDLRCKGQAICNLGMLRMLDGRLSDALFLYQKGTAMLEQTGDFYAVKAKTIIKDIEERISELSNEENL